MICVADEPRLNILEGLINQEFAQRVAGHQLGCALFSIVLFTQDIQDIQEEMKQQVREVEVRTGHHWKPRKETPALGDLIALAAKMSGSKTRIDSCLRKQSVLKAMISFIEKESRCTWIDDDEDMASYEPSGSILKSVTVVKQRVAGQEIDMTFIQRRVRTQIDAIYHLIQEDDALSAGEMARDCKLLAMASQRDSASMKCIAVVTMLFLPGTFVAALLSIPLFDWQAKSTELMYRTSYWKPRITIFLALTVPITLLTFGVWGFWTLGHLVKDRKKIASAQAQLHLEDETRTLSMKRKLLIEQS
ncbi:hypothetical protein EDD36DRAFT_317275 [Exophiala viscosa]|uniref:Ankyrin repeat protein n=1 Tax=Exophiala viscosa TaxID=2486360 RepID=A0AAN6DQG8_9EURO|nr:hypothetical protein EDD36DRAFT_317275 [Exophiala viscosa]